MKPAIRKGILALVGLLSTAALGQQEYNGIEYLRPTAAGQKKASHPVTGSVRFDDDTKALEFLDENGVSVVTIPCEKITSLQNVTKGVGPTLVHFHDPKHFFKISYTDNKGKPNFVAVNAAKGEARNVMLAAQAASGKQIEDKDECCVWF